MPPLSKEEVLDGIARYGTRAAFARSLGVDEASVRRAIARLDMQREVEELQAKSPGYRAEKAPEPQQEIPLIDIGYETTHRLYPLGDVHLGSPSHRQRLWEQWLAYLLEQKNASLIGTGDFMNTALADSKSDVYTEAMTVPNAKRLLRKQLEPLAKEGRIDCLMPGNHEDRITKKTGDCPIRDVCEFLDIPYVAKAVRLKYRIGGIDYRVYVRHGTGLGQSTAALPKSRLVVERADVYITAHTHRQQVLAEDVFDFDGHRRKVYCVSSGSFVGYEPYAAERGYPPSRLGAPRIHLDANRHDCHVSL